MLRAVIGAAALAMALADGAGAQERLKIGLIQSLTGPFNTVGRATVNGAQLYVQQHGDVGAGRRIELVVRDDLSAPDRAKRIAQEMIVNDGVSIICAGITPSALAVAQIFMLSFLRGGRRAKLRERWGWGTLHFREGR